VSDLLRNAHFFLQSLSWRDALDVLVVAFLLYQLLKLIRGTQAVQLLLGLAVIFAVGWAAQLLHLRLLEFIFTNGTQAIVIAAIVLFQPELRRALDQVGRLGTVRAVLGRHPEVAYARTVDEVLRAALSLSERKVGALIVFERETGLENLAATGVAVNGDVHRRDDRHHLHPRIAAARRRGDHPRQPHRRGRVRAAPRGDAPRRGPDGHAAPRRTRAHHAE